MASPNILRMLDPMLTMAAPIIVELLNLDEIQPDDDRVDAVALALACAASELRALVERSAPQFDNVAFERICEAVKTRMRLAGCPNLFSEADRFIDVTQSR